MDNLWILPWPVDKLWIVTIGRDPLTSRPA
jgi:hypothetical protein